MPALSGARFFSQRRKNRRRKARETNMRMPALHIQITKYFIGGKKIIMPIQIIYF
jgi:hypothetical protein